MTADWKRLLDHIESIPERIYEHWNPTDGWDNDTQFGAEYGENGVPWCVIFAWDMYHDCGLDAVVPKVDNVVVFSDWAKGHGQWSEYPSVGAWVNLGNGHCELVVGFDEVNVYTKGGNSLQAGAVDNGQGNGVWSHSAVRRSSRVVGYLAPRFPDGVCPPTADPNDPRGGKPVASYRWPGPDSAPQPQPKPTPQLEPWPGYAFFTIGRNSPIITAMGKRLVAVGCGSHYRVGPGPVFSQADMANYADWQRKCGVAQPYDGIPGPESWGKLQVPKS